MEHSKTWNMRKILKHGMRGMSFKKKDINITREEFTRRRYVSPLPFCASRTVPKHRRLTLPHSEKEKWRKTMVSVLTVLKT